MGHSSGGAAVADPNALERMVSGGVAGALSRSITAPIDRVRILYQVNPNRKFTVRAALKTGRIIYSSTGLKGLWRGNGVALVRVVPYSGTLFSTYPTFEHLAAPFVASSGVVTGDNAKITTRFVAGALAGATATTLTYPLDLMRARMAAHWGPDPPYRGYVSGLQVIVSKEGFGALFHGIRPTLYGIIPHCGIGFMTFETIKSKIIETQNLSSDREVPTLYRLAAGGFSGFVSQSVTYPFHVVRRRMQVGGSIHHRSGFLQAVRQIWAKEGARGLFKGISLTWLKGPVTVALGFTFNDMIKGSVHHVRHNVKAVLAWRPAEKDAKGVEGDDGGQRKLTALESLLAGAIAGSVAKTSIAPMDRVKIVFQVGDKPYNVRSAVALAARVVRESSLLALWRGNGATLMRVIPYSGTTYLTYDRYLAMLTTEQPTTVHCFIAGSMAGVTATTLTYPLDLLRARMAARMGVNAPCPSYREAVAEVVAKDGYGQLFAGLRPTLLGIVPYAGLSFMTFEWLKARLRSQLGLERDRDIPTGKRMTAGGLAGFVAQSATYPLDIVRRRMQVGTLSPQLSVFEAASTVMREHGWRALYNGLSMNLFKGPMAIAISFTTNDIVKTYLNDVNMPEKITRWRAGDAA